MVVKFKPHLAVLLCLVVATLVVYGRILGHDFQIAWDDDLYVVENPMVRGLTFEHIRRAFSGQYFGNYAPLHLISYMLDYELWGMWPGGYLLTNLGLHIVNGLLVYRLIIQLHAERYMAAAAAAVFLLHPLQVESVAWISQRKNLLAMLFFLLAWECYRRYRETGGRMRWLAYGGSLVLFSCSLLSKSVAVIFPVVLILYDLCFPVSAGKRGLGRGDSRGGDDVSAGPDVPASLPARCLSLLRQVRWLDKVPFIVATAAAIWMTMQSQAPSGDNWDGAGGGRVAYHGGSPLTTFFSMLPVFCRYLGLLAWPAGLNADYSAPVRMTADVTVWLAAALLAAIGWLCIRLLQCNLRFGFWALVFWVGFLPVSQIVPLVTLMNDRYVYFPMLGAAALAGAGVLLAVRRSPRRIIPVLYGFLAVIMCVMSAATYLRIGVWRDSVALWQDSVAKSPDRALSWVSLAQAYERTGSGMPREAIDAFNRALILDPVNAYALYGLGRLYGVTGDYDRAFDYITRLLQQSPEHVMGLTLLGTVYERRGQYDLAEQTYQRAASLQPEAVDIAMQLANLAVVRGDLAMAHGRYLLIESRGDNFPVVAYMLSWLELQAGHEDLALAWLEKALQRGYAGYRSIADLEELTALRGNPRFEELLRRYGGSRGVER